VKADSVAEAVLPWADDLFLHCQELIRWVTDYVDLEESLAIGSVAQEELAHANALLEQSGCTLEERDWRIFVREQGEWFPSRLVLWPADDWPATVARGFLLTQGSLVVVARLQQHGGERLARTAAVVGAEQQLHARHWRRWVDILAREPDSAEAFGAYLAEAAAACADLFGFPRGRAASLEPEPMHRAFLDAVGKDLVELGVPVPSFPTEPVERTAGGVGPQLARQLARVRQIRDAHPDRVYGIYR
jgi:1,2-phenylacetyl-CoA epoxidase catalytic subunit